MPRPYPAPLHVKRSLLRLLIVTMVLVVPAVVAAKPACSKSERLYDAAKSAGVTINGTWVTLPNAPQWERLVPLYDLLKDYDASVAYGNDCKAMVRRLQQKVLDRIKLYGTFLVVNINDPLNRLNGNGAVTIDGVAVVTSDAGAQADGPSTLPGHLIFRGTHQVKLKQPVLQPGERLVLEAKLDGKTIGKGEALDFSLDIPANEASGPAMHTLTLGLGIKRSCKVRLRVSGNMLGPPRPNRPEFVAEVYNPRQFTNQRLQNGDYQFPAGEYTLALKLSAGELSEKVSPRVIIDDAQVGLKAFDDEGVPSWQRRLSLVCPADQAHGETMLELGFAGDSRSVAAAVNEPVSENASEVNVPTLTWVGVAAVGVGSAVAAISHFGYFNPAQSDADYLFVTYGCGTESLACTQNVQDEILARYDTRDTATSVTIAGLVVGGAGALVAAGAWLLAEPSSDDVSGRELTLLPVIQRGAGALHLTGTF